MKIVCDGCDEEMTVICEKCAVPPKDSMPTNADWEILHKRHGMDMGGLLQRYGVADLNWDLVQELMKRQEISFQIRFERGKNS